jgi:uncharacterized protein YjbJ (UPF0337 family)
VSDDAGLFPNLGGRRVRAYIAIQETQMNSMTDKAKGLANEATGKVKQGVGKLVGSDKVEAEGVAQEAKGAVQKATGDAKTAVKHGADKVAGAINKNL